MSTLPNWVDLILVTLIIRACYVGLGQGVWIGLLNLVGVVGVTVITLNYAGPLAVWLRQWSAFPQPLIALLSFWGLFVTGLVALRALVGRVSEALRARPQWIAQALGMVVGGLRGLWWAGFLLVVCASSGIAYLRTSVEERSLLGPRLLAVSRGSLEGVTGWLPGSSSLRGALVPPLWSGPASRPGSS